MIILFNETENEWWKHLKDDGTFDLKLSGARAVQSKCCQNSTSCKTGKEQAAPKVGLHTSGTDSDKS